MFQNTDGQSISSCDRFEGSPDEGDGCEICGGYVRHKGATCEECGGKDEPQDAYDPDAKYDEWVEENL